MNSRLQIKEQAVRLFYKFLKEHKLFNRVYMKPRHKNVCAPIMNKAVNHNITDLWVDYSDYLTINEDYIYGLQMSQLWRFYLLEHLDEINFDTYNKDKFRKIIKSAIRYNGDRNSEEIKELIKKHGIYE